MLADNCHGHLSDCAKYAASSWSPGGLILLAAIILLVVAWFRRK